MDKLEEIFRMQVALNQRIGVSLPPPTDEEKAKWILNYTRAMQQETAELIDSVPWKWWAKYQKFDEQNAKVEVVDEFTVKVDGAVKRVLAAASTELGAAQAAIQRHMAADAAKAKKAKRDADYAQWLKDKAAADADPTGWDIEAWVEPE